MRSAVLLSIFLFTLVAHVQSQVTEPDKIIEHRDIAYMDKGLSTNDSLQRLNLVLPVGVKHSPLLIWIGGGAWAYVDRHQEMDLARQFAREGIAVASIGHRLSSAIWLDSSLHVGIQHPSHIEDVASAVKWLHQNVANM